MRRSMARKRIDVFRQWIDTGKPAEVFRASTKWLPEKSPQMKLGA